MKKIGILLAALVVTLLTFGGPAIAQDQSGDTITVDDDQQQCENAAFSSINAAIIASSAGDTIKVCPGLYNENVNVNKTLTLNGSGGNPRERSGDTKREAVVTGTPAIAPAIFLDADDIVLSGFTIQGTDNNAGLYSTPTFSGYRIEKNLITDNTFGLYLHSSGTTRTIVSENVFDSNNRAGSASGAGIYSDQGLQNARITHNFFTGHESASIILVTAADVRIDHNEIKNDNSIVLLNTTNTFVESNKILRPRGTGILVDGGSTSLRILLNELRNGDSEGIVLATEFVSQPSEVLIQRNFLTGFESDGIQLRSGSTGNNVLGNQSIDNGRDGIRLENASGNYLNNNVMKKNTEFDAYDDNRPANRWRQSECKTDFPKGTICK